MEGVDRTWKKKISGAEARMNNNEELGEDEAMFVEEDETSESFNELCSDLNLDATTRDNTWRTFATVRQKYTLEVSERMAKSN